MKYKNKVALLYDFDGTLAPGNMQEFTFAPKLLGMERKQWWDTVNCFGESHNMDPTLSVMYMMMTVAKQKGVNITRDDFVSLGKDIHYFNGVETWFDHINDFAKKYGLEIQHYVISSGLKEIIEGTSISKHFKRIFASCYAYDKNGDAFWPSQAVNYTTKQQFIHRIRKNAIDSLYETKSVVEVVDNKEELFPYDHMIYFGDGETDIPAMKTISKKGGQSICVYDPDKPSAYQKAKKIYLTKRADNMACADWSQGSELCKLVEQRIIKIASYLQ